MQRPVERSLQNRSGQKTTLIMNKYDVKHQKNVYFIDLDKLFYHGYIETTVMLNEKADTIEYLVGGLIIESVEIDYGNGYVEADYEHKIPEVAGYSGDCSSLWKELYQGQKLMVKPEKFEKEVKVRIVYGREKENLSICFYTKDPHKECIGQNINFRSHFIFPNISTDLGYSFDIFYIVPEKYNVISPGKFVGTVEQRDMMIHSYSLEYAFPGNISFAAGTFESVEIVSGDETKTFYVPVRHSESKILFKENAKNMIPDFLGCMRFIETFLDIEYPSLSVLFTLSPTRFLAGQNMFITNIVLLPSSNSVEQNFVFREAASKILVSQLFLNLKEPGYIKAGVTGYMEDNCIKHFFGNNEMLLRVKKEKDFVIKNDVRELSLDDPRRDEFSMSQSFFRLKSKLFIHLLENNLSEAFMQRILLGLRNKKQIKTEGFIKIIKNIAGKDMTEVFSTYVSRPGSVVFRCFFQIDQNKNRVTFNIKQRPTSIVENANRRFVGNLHIRVFEIEGVFDHSYNLSKSELVFYYHTRTKKTKKKEAEPLMPLLWIRADPKNEYLAGIELNQPDFMYIEALIHEKSVSSQYEALKSLEIRPSEQTCNVHIFYKIRMEAALILSEIFLENYDGYQKIIQFFVKKYCLQGSTIIKPNDFSNFSNYFIEIGLIRAISFSFPLKCRVVNDKKITVRDVAIAFINNVLLYNDNDSNNYEDSFYVSNAIDSLSLPLCSQKLKDKGGETRGFESLGKDAGLNFGFEGEPGDEGRAVLNAESDAAEVVLPEKFKKALDLSIELVEKYRKFDLVSPSISNKVTTSCLGILGRLYSYGYVEIDRDILMKYSLPSNFVAVRLVSLELLLLKRDKDIMNHILRVLKYDHYLVKLHIIISIKNLLSASLLDFHSFFSEFKPEFYNLLKLFSHEFVLFRHLTEVILFIEKKGKVKILKKWTYTSSVMRRLVGN